jgi:hypothetical protein
LFRLSTGDHPAELSWHKESPQVLTSTVRAESADCKPQAGQVAYYRRVPEAALLDRRLTRTALALLGVLDGYAREKAECWPSVARLRADLGCCRRTVQLALALLKRCDYLAERPAQNPTGRLLILTWKRGAQAPAPPPAQRPYSQGIPRERRRFAPQGRGMERKEGKGFAPPPGPQSRITAPAAPRLPDRPPTPQERAETRRQWLEAVPIGSALGLLLARRYAQA